MESLLLLVLKFVFMVRLNLYLTVRLLPLHLLQKLDSSCRHVYTSKDIFEIRYMFFSLTVTST
jgi:hypothetical protein